MSDSPTPTQRVGRALTDPSRGVIGLVDELLSAALGRGIQLKWAADRCRVRLWGNGPPDDIELPIQKSVFRAALARVAVLCNERNPDSASPYGGEGVIVIDDDAAKAIRVNFSNRDEALFLDLFSTPRGMVLENLASPGCSG